MKTNDLFKAMFNAKSEAYIGSRVEIDRQNVIRIHGVNGCPIILTFTREPHGWDVRVKVSVVFSDQPEPNYVLLANNVEPSPLIQEFWTTMQSRAYEDTEKLNASRIETAIQIITRNTKH